MTYNELVIAIHQIDPDAMIYQVGSKILPYIKHSHDNDVVVFCASHYMFIQLSVWTTDYLNTHYPKEWDVHILSLERRPNFIWDRFYAYQYHFIPNLDPRLCTHDLYDRDIRANHIKWGQYFVQRFPRDVNKKSYYHLYTLLAMWKNGNYELTTEDTERINRFHDKIATEEDFVVLEEMLNNEIQKLEEEA